MKIFDTHCHLNFQAFQNDYEAVIRRAQNKQIEMLILGTDLKTSLRAIELAKKYSGVYAGVGFHPVHIKNRDWQLEVKSIIELAKNPVVKAIGEVGYDNFYLKKSEYYNALQIQKEILDSFFREAIKLKKPLVLHSRGWLDKLENKIQQFLPDLQEIGLVLHCFPGNLTQAKFLTNHNFYLGFNGLITQKSAWNDIIRQVKLENILLETDAPFLTPVSQGKKRNEPIFVKDVAEYISQLKKITIEKVAKITYQNARNFLRLE